MPLLSIIIPTHERSDYANNTIASLLTLNVSQDLLEIVVCDSSVIDNISGNFSDEIAIGLLRYYHCPENDNVVKNFEYAYSKASGDYLLSIGDDDIVSWYIIDVVSQMRSESIDILNVKFTCEYFWNGFSHSRLGQGLSDSMKVRDFSGRWFSIDARKEKHLACERIGHGLGLMPRAYLGVISRELYHKVIVERGHLFGGVSPDIYSSSLLCDFATNAMLLDIPVIIPGATKKSTSGKSVTGEHTGKLRNNAHIGAFKELQWNKFIPEFYSVPTVWGYSIFVSMEDKSKFNLCTLYLHCLLRHPEFRNASLIAFREYCREVSVSVLMANIFRAFGNEFLWFVDALNNRFMQGRGKLIAGVGGINSARLLVDEVIRRKKHDS